MSNRIAVAHGGMTYRHSMHSLTVILLLAIPAALVLAAAGYFSAGLVLSLLEVFATKARKFLQNDFPSDCRWSIPKMSLANWQ